MRCLMPGARPSVEPLSAGESSGSSASDEVSQLELQSQRQLEEDVARIFDESIYSDLEVVCGKLKILTHSCILKARTHKFYHKLEAILHVNIGRNTFDEIYSFISDAYTECNIKNQEKEIIDYLNENLSLGNNVKNKVDEKNKVEQKVDELEVYSTPNCVSPEEKGHQKISSSSPSTELTKEYYALVPIDGNVLDKELIEQDALSNAFQFISKSQFDDINAKQNTQCVKPTSLCLNSSHIPKIYKHSTSFDILKKNDSNSDFVKKAIGFDGKKINNETSHTRNPVQQSEADKSAVVNNKTSNLPETSTDKVLDPTYTPDSLITDEPSSSSDYLSAAYAVSPGTVFSSGFSQLNVGEIATKMDNIVTISDSGLETSGMLESIISHKDVTLTDVSLTESTLQEMANDDNNFQDSACNVLDKSHVQVITQCKSLNSPSSGTSLGKDFNERKSNKSSLTEMNSTKEEKQRQNEEIVILESSSLSSETGSWESVFPPKLPEKDLCERFITSERKNALEEVPHDTRKLPHDISNIQHEKHDNLCPSLVQKLPYKSTSCFIDAASLADEGDDVLVMQTEIKDTNSAAIENLLVTSQPVPNTLKQDLSPNDWSGSYENEDSLEQASSNSKDFGSIQKDLSRNILESPHKTEYSLPRNACTTTYETRDTILAENGFIAVEYNHSNATNDTVLSGNGFIRVRSNTRQRTNTNENSHPKETIEPIQTGNGFMQCRQNTIEQSDTDEIKCSKAAIDLMRVNYSMSSAYSTPNNSIVSVKSIDFKSYEPQSEENAGDISDNSSLGRRLYNDENLDKTIPSLHISNISSKASITPAANSSLLNSQSNSSFTKREIENIPIVSGAYIPEPEEVPERPPKTLSTSSFWVVDMSSSPRSDISEYNDKLKNKPVEKSIEELRSASKPTTSGDSYKSRSSVDSDSSDKSNHKFFIDFSTLPDAPISEQGQDEDESNEKNNIFPIFIDFGASAKTKELPFKFTSTPRIKNSAKTLNKSRSNISNASESNNKSSDVIATHATEDSALFEKLETLCSDPSISITDIIKIKHSGDVPGDSNIKRKDNDLLPEVIQEEPAAEEPVNLFVKLSDLDKPASTAEPVAITVNRESHERMTRSIPDNDWGESSLTINLGSSSIISSFHSENALSLNRLFPHLKNEFSRSMPGSLSSRTRSPLRLGTSSSPGDIDDCHASDVSELSSVQSSYCRSVVENSTTEENELTTSLISNCQSRLGQDLLRMFLEEIAPDVIVEVAGRRIKAHKCILSSRCQYFAGMLSGGWVESAGNVISLPPFSFSVVHFALCHIYSGVSVIPDSISIVELATLADMLGLEGLKEGIMFMLKNKYCHHFHKPCGLCTAGVLECFPLASVYGLDDLYRKCLRWITKHFQRVWPTKAFATLPFELIEKCYQDNVNNLTADNFVQIVHGCGIAAMSLPSTRWAGVVERMCRRLVIAAAQFAAGRLCEVLRAMRGAGAAEAPQVSVQTLNDCLAVAMEWAPPEHAVHAYHLLSDLRAPPRLGLLADSPLHAHVPDWLTLCEDVLVRNAQHVTRTAAFAELPAELRKRLRDIGCIAYGRRAARTARAARAARVARVAHASFVTDSPRPQVRVASADSLRAQARVASADSPRAQGRVASVDSPRVQARVASVDSPRVQARVASVDSPRVQARVASVDSPRVQARVASVDSPRAQARVASAEAPRAQARAAPAVAPPQPRAAPAPRPAGPRGDRMVSRMNKTFPPSVRSTRAQEERARYNSTKTHQPPECAPARPVRAAYENTRPRYLEPRQPKPAAAAPARKPQPRLMSSSDSSRNSSPVLPGARARHSRESLRPRTADLSTDSLRVRTTDVSTDSLRPQTADVSTDSLRPQTADVSTDSLRPQTADVSTDSLSETQSPNKYATYTKAKHNTEGSFEAVHTPAKRVVAGASSSASSQPVAEPTAKTQPKSTKIPVYVNKSPQPSTSGVASSKEAQRRVEGDKSINSSLSPLLQRNKPSERKPSGSLMNATKSSQAKVVSKAVKETTNSKVTSKHDKTPEPKMSKSKTTEARSPNAEIPAMERSGTFLKDEPTFGDKTTNIDIDE